MGIVGPFGLGGGSCSFVFGVWLGGFFPCCLWFADLGLDFGVASFGLVTLGLLCIVFGLVLWLVYSDGCGLLDLSEGLVCGFVWVLGSIVCVWI